MHIFFGFTTAVVLVWCLDAFGSAGSCVYSTRELLLFVVFSSTSLLGWGGLCLCGVFAGDYFILARGNRVGCS